MARLNWAALAVVVAVLGALSWAGAGYTSEPAEYRAVRSAP